MAGELPFLITHGDVLGFTLLAAVAVAAGLLGAKLLAVLRRLQSKRLVRSLGAATAVANASRGASITASGTLLSTAHPVNRHEDGAPVIISSASRYAGSDVRRARRVALAVDGGVVLLRGPVRLLAGATETWTRDASVVTAIVQSYVTRIWMPARVRSVASGDALVVRGRVRTVKRCNAGHAVVLESAELVYTGSIATRPSVRTRLRHALVAALITLLVATAVGYGGVRLAQKGPTLGLRWSGAVLAAMTPLRPLALEAAEDVLALALAAKLPELDAQPNQYFRERGEVHAEPETRRYIALSRLRKDCTTATDRLTSFAAVHADLTELAADRLLECKQPLALKGIAEARFWESDPIAASTLYDRAAIVWGETDKDQPYASNLEIHNLRKEINVHWLARRFDAAARTIDRARVESKASRPGLECARWTFGFVSNEPGALEQLKKLGKECVPHLANVDPSARATLLANPRDYDLTRNLYQIWAMQIEPALRPGTPYDQAVNASHSLEVETPHELLSFPHGAHDFEPSIVLELLARVKGAENPSAGLRIARARLFAAAATFESLLGEHASARAHLRRARADLAALLGLPQEAAEKAGITNYERGSLELESRHVAVLEVGILLLAGDVSAAARAADAISDTPVSGPTPEVFSRDLEDLRASLELVRAFVELWQGKPDRYRRFAESKLCDELSGCFIVRGELAELEAAAKGKVQGCDETSCLVAAKCNAPREALLERADQAAASAAVSDNPLERVYRIGFARRLAQAIGDADRSARLDRWLSLFRAPALDPRLAITRRTLENTH